MAKKKNMVYPVIFMIILTGVLTLILAFVNEISLPMIEFNAEIELKQKILSVFDILPANSTPEEIDKIFNENISEDMFNDSPLYILSENGEEIAYAVPFNGPGLWGSIHGYLGLKSDLKTVTGIEFIKQEETPGLGGRIGEPFYRDQFRGLDISNASNGEIFINRPAPGGNVDAISGATQTSTFVTNMLNKDITSFIDSRGGM